MKYHNDGILLDKLYWYKFVLTPTLPQYMQFIIIFSITTYFTKLNEEPR